MKPLSLGFSPCPNDTFLFYALVHGLIAGAPPVRPELYDVETLNRRARAGELALTKVSYGVIPALVDRYAILHAGGPLGRGCGPLVVARSPGVSVADLPGRGATAGPAG